MHERVGRAWGWCLALALHGAAGLCFAAGANLSGTGRALSLTAGVSQEVVVATFNDTLTTRNARVVDRMFEDLLGRPADAGSLAMFIPQVGSPQGRQAVVASLLGSREYDIRLVQDWYEQFLDRAADGGSVPLVDALHAGTRDEAILGLILSSDEYFHGHGGGTNDGFLDALYQDLLGRPIDNASRAYFESMLALGPRSAVVTIVTASGEYRGRMVRGYYTGFLGREATPGEVNLFVTQIQNGARYEDVIAAIVSSQEYYEHVPMPVYAALVAWGDGQVAAGTVAPHVGGGFEIRATHAYVHAGYYVIPVTISDGLGGLVVVNSKANVTPAVSTKSR